MKSKKKFMAVVLMLSMLISMMPMTALAAEGTTKEVYVELVEQGTENLFSGAELTSAYYVNAEVDVPFEKVSEGKYVLTLDAETYAGDFVICEFAFPEGYRQVGYDVEPMGGWVSQWASSGENYVIEVCSKEKGYGTELFQVFDEEYNIFDGTEIYAALYKDVEDFETEIVKLAETTTGKLTFDYEYENGNFLYNGEEYKDLLIYVDFPFGYTREGNSVDMYSCEALWYTAETFAGHTLDDLYAEQYLDDLSITSKDVYLEFVDGKTGEAFTDIELEYAFYANLDTFEIYGTEMSKQEDGVFKLTLDGKTYQNHTIWAEFECPEGYAFEGMEDTIWSDYVDRWFINGEKIMVEVVKQNETDEPEEPSEEPVLSENIIYEILDEKGNILNNGSMKVWVSDAVGPDAEKTLIYESVSGYGEIPVEYTDTEFLYNGEGYSFIIYECHFPTGYVTYYEPEEEYLDPAYISGGTWYYNVSDLSAENFTWSWTLEKEDEKYETEPTEETFTYEFIEEDGTVVAGTNVVISLCNEMESEDKVIIAETTTGEGEFTIYHMGDYYYHEGDVYTWVEISYRFPEGYVLADSDGTTENTVWYSVENLCDGSNSITWILEEMKEQKPEVPSEPETPAEPESPVESDKEVDSDKLVEETVDQIKKEENQHVQVVVSESNKIDKEIFDSMKKHEKDVTIGVKDKDGSRVEYSWTFSNKEMDNRDIEVDIHINFDDKKKDGIKEHVGRDDMLCINFSHHGKLPGPATIKNYVGDKYKDGDKLYLYYFNEELDKVLRIGNKPLEVKDGYIEYTITHCSTYFVMYENLSDVEMDETSLVDATISVLDNDFSGTLATNTSDTKVPVTGDRAPIYLYIVIMLLGVTILFVSKKHRVNR